MTRPWYDSVRQHSLLCEASQKCCRIRSCSVDFSTRKVHSRVLHGRRRSVDTSFDTAVQGPADCLGVRSHARLHGVDLPAGHAEFNLLPEATTGFMPETASLEARITVAGERQGRYSRGPELHGNGYAHPLHVAEASGCNDS